MRCEPSIPRLNEGTIQCEQMITLLIKRAFLFIFNQGSVTLSVATNRNSNDITPVGDRLVTDWRQRAAIINHYSRCPIGVRGRVLLHRWIIEINHHRGLVWCRQLRLNDDYFRPAGKYHVSIITGLLVNRTHAAKSSDWCSDSDSTYDAVVSVGNHRPSQTSSVTQQLQSKQRADKAHSVSGLKRYEVPVP